MLPNAVTQPLTVKYTVLATITVALILGALLVDRNRRLARSLRVAAYLGMLLFTVIDWLVTHILLDISYPFIALLASVGLAVTIYAEGYGRVLFGLARILQVPLEILSATMLFLYTSTYIIEFVMFWIITELVGFMIILFEGTRRAWRAAITYLVIGALTADISLFTMLAIIGQNIGLEEVFTARIIDLASYPVPYAPLITILLLLGFMGKSALIPFHFWLPDAYTVSPSPATALFSGVMEKMSLFGILILYRLLKIDVYVAVSVLLGLGFVTTIYAAIQALLQSDAKRLLSYSTMGYSGCLIGLSALYLFSGYDNLILTGLILLMFSHGISKSLLFLNTGTMEILANTREIYSLGYLARIDRVGALTVIIGAMSLLGAPATIGFMGKFSAFLAGISSFFVSGTISIVYIISLAYMSSMGIVYMLKFLGSYYGGFTPAISRVKKYYILDWGEIINSAIIFLYSVIGSIYVYQSTGSALIVALNLASLLVVLVAIYMLAKRRLRFREDEAWIGGVYP